MTQEVYIGYKMVEMKEGIKRSYNLKSYKDYNDSLEHREKL